MAPFYNLGDQNIYDSGQYFIPQEKYRLNYVPPIIEEEQESIGIPNTNSFINFVNNQNNNRIFDPNAFTPYSAQPSESFVTNRSSIGNTGYIQGTEPEETYMDKIGGLIKKGIGMAIPGGNFLMGMADNLSRENRLNAFDNAFIDQQLGIKEQNIHGFGNLPNQDRYGYNKESMFGNYADLVAERVEIANQRIAAGKDLRDIDKYYMEKQKEQEDIEEQINFNNFINQRITANKLRELQNKNINLYPDGTQIHGGDGGDGGDGRVTTKTTTTTPNIGVSLHGGDGGNNQSNAPAPQRDYSRHHAYGLRRGGIVSLYG